MLEKTRILAIVVTHHPDNSFASRFERLAGQVGGMLIVDNNSDAEDVSMLREVAGRLNVTLLLNSQNLGLASALNIGATRAIDDGYEWALLFDQDTLPGDDIVDGLREAYQQFPEKGRLAIMGSNYRDPHTNEPVFGASGVCGAAWRERKVVITSGSLISLRAYEAIGGFKAEYFVDCVDLEYCLRARSKGFKVIMTCAPLMVHGIGRPTRHDLLGKKIAAGNHGRVRWYYMVRNDIHLAKKYIFREPGWVLANLWTRFKSMIVVCIFEHDRFAKVRYSVMGLFDGLHSKLDRKLS